MMLYCPAESLRIRSSLQTKQKTWLKGLPRSVRTYSRAFGMLSISAVKDRYCVEVPEEGCSYIEREIPVPGAPAEPSAGDRNAWKHNGTGLKPLFFYAEKMHTTVDENASEEHGWYFSFRTRL